MPRPRCERERFTEKVDVTFGCWFWTGASSEKGYGQFVAGSRADGTRRRMLAHRYAYEIENGPIGDGLEIDHLCFTPSCVRPDHLRVVTRAENLAARRPFLHPMSLRTHCPSGHEYTPENTRLYDGRRHCRACGRIASKRWYQTTRRVA